MGRALEAVRTRGLDTLFSYFGLEVEPRLVEEHRDQITRRFAAEVDAIVSLCARLRERERFTIVREALRMSYESATLRTALSPDLHRPAERGQGGGAVRLTDVPGMRDGAGCVQR